MPACVVYGLEQASRFAETMDFLRDPRILLLDTVAVCLLPARLLVQICSWRHIVANHKSAAKRARQTIRRTARNILIRSRIKTVVRSFREALAGQDKVQANSTFEVAARELRKAASKGILKKTTVSRRVSRLTLAMNAYNAQHS